MSDNKQAPEYDFGRFLDYRPQASQLRDGVDLALTSIASARRLLQHAGAELAPNVAGLLVPLLGEFFELVEDRLLQDAEAYDGFRKADLEITARIGEWLGPCGLENLAAIHATKS